MMSERLKQESADSKTVMIKINVFTLAISLATSACHFCIGIIIAMFQFCNIDHFHILRLFLVIVLRPLVRGTFCDYVMY